MGVLIRIALSVSLVYTLIHFMVQYVPVVSVDY